MKKMILLLTLLLFSALQAYSNAKQYTIEDATRVALENNYQTKSGVLEIQKAEAAVNEAYGYALPNFGFSTSFMHYLETPKMPFPDFQAMLTNATYNLLFEEALLPRDNSKFLPMNTVLQSFFQKNSYEAKFEFSQILFNSAVFRGIGASGTYLETSKVALKANIVTTVNNVRKSFNYVLLAKSLLEITRSSFENANKNLSNVKAYKEQGLVSEFDALQAEVQVENLRPIVLQMENTLKLAKEGLKLAMGIPNGDDIDVVGSLDYSHYNLPNANDAIAHALDNNYDIQTLKNKQKVDDAFVDLHRSEYWPQLVAFGNYSFNGSSDDLKFQNYRSAMVGLSLNINLFSGMQTKNRVEQGLIEVKKTQTQIEQLKHFVSMQVKSQINELERIISHIEAQERNINLAQRSYELSTIRYREGTGSQLEIQNADLSLRQAKTNLLQSHFEFNNAKSELEALLGTIDNRYFLVYSNYINNRK